MATVAELRAVFPASIPFPPLLADFVAWAAPLEWGQLGYFSFHPERLNDFWIENGTALAEHFALFIHLPDGSMIGFWQPENHNGPCPVVLLGSEGAQEILGAALEDFLLNWATGEVGEASDLVPDDEDEEDDAPEDARPALLEWLRERGVTATAGDPLPDLPAFFDAWQAAQHLERQAQPTLQAFAEYLAPHAKRKMEAWDSMQLVAEFAGPHLKLSGVPYPQDDEATLLALCAQLRTGVAQAYPARGAWFSARICWFASGDVIVQADYLNLPPDVALADALADLNRFPRNVFWTPEWAN